MSIPLQYANLLNRALAEVAETTQPPRMMPRTTDGTAVPIAIPAEFDVLLTSSDDHAAVSAVDAALRREKIVTFRVDDTREMVGRKIRLLVKSADRDRASVIAAQVFARRARVKSFPHTKPVRETATTRFAGMRTTP